MTLTIFHNPRCSKSREALRLIEAQGLEPRVIRYLDDPPDAATLEALLGMLGIEPRALMRTKEAEYGALGLDDPGLSREALIAAMVAHPRLIERPVVVKDGKAVIGRPPERVLSVL
jgi:arsenate reductase